MAAPDPSRWVDALSDAVLNASRALAKLALERAEQQHAEKEAT